MPIKLLLIENSIRGIPSLLWQTFKNRAGDPLLTLVPDKQISQLNLPMPSLFNKKCSVFTPIKFLESDEHQCHVVLDKDVDCSQVPELNSINYVNGFQILSNLDLTENITNQNFGADQLLLPRPEVCINLGNDEKVCVDLALNEALSQPTKVCS